MASEDAITCPRCGESFHSAGGLEQHRRTAHGPEAPAAEGGAAEGGETGPTWPDVERRAEPRGEPKRRRWKLF